ncbi:hypothetical protein H6F86_25690 [Phormidium sp. FACHB-592]|uniref:Uncharacterized protein n=1 Tax=Stenomitos frigidus AS-A4 TaxID=2933935 RepID=A0ABV0KSB5_9CYAN|nr:hypothetical protein [Phormidium sp. FACHB-592]MBD2077212.1 hypothetical protein [Phormidium sp. FACHB-592]
MGVKANPVQHGWRKSPTQWFRLAPEVRISERRRYGTFKPMFLGQNAFMPTVPGFRYLLKEVELTHV